jgi:hypothetical protein
MNIDHDKKLLSTTLISYNLKNGKSVLGTTNKKILDFLGLKTDLNLLKTFVDQQNIQFINVIADKIENIDCNDVIGSCLIGMPGSFLPSFLTSTMLDDQEKQQAAEANFQNILPLLTKIKEFQNLGVSDWGDSNNYNAIYNLSEKLKSLNIFVPEDTIQGFITFISYSATLAKGFLKNYETLDYLPSVKYVFKEQNFVLQPKTYNEFLENLNDPNFVKTLKDVYVNFINKFKTNLLEKYQKDLQEIENNVKDVSELNSLVSVHEVKNQLLDSIEDLKCIDVETDLKSIDIPAIIYKYWPFQVLPPIEMYVNLPAFGKKEIVFIKSLIAANFMEDPLIVLLNPEPYINELKNLRKQQILTYKIKFIEEVKNDIAATEDENEKKDLLDIINLLDDDKKLFENELSNLSNAFQVMGYWPNLLYPAPTNIVTNE